SWANHIAFPFLRFWPSLGPVRRSLLIGSGCRPAPARSPEWPRRAALERFLAMVLLSPLGGLRGFALLLVLEPLLGRAEPLGREIGSGLARPLFQFLLAIGGLVAHRCGPFVARGVLRRFAAPSCTSGRR